MPPSPTPPMRVLTIPEVPSSMVGPRTETGHGRAPALNIYEDSLVVSPSGSVVTGLLCNMIPNRDVTRVRNATNSEVVGLFAAQFAAVELDETKARAEAEIGRLRSEATNARGLGKEEFLNSSEFDDLCTNRSLAYSKSDFQSCVAQLRANVYSKEDHPARFLSMAQAVEELPDDEKNADDGADEDAS
ncbi:peptidase [Dorcoceras hygrometricum]|uniref:Peptidase n=1 Tax=Dorcoceras hygrometricum TaxID=472368 RepID=A0A2Z7CCL1_9LAMI|nr:peptidase [Dorcoceras hygrometricum]